MQVLAIDVETTGLSTRKDRVVEVAGVIYDLQANDLVGEFETLINPMRNISEDSTNSHGLSAHHVSAAPTFAEFGPWLAALMKNRVVIAHNAGFDSVILKNEFARSGIEFELSDWICTYRMTDLSLPAACNAFEIELLDHHSALADARACLEIFKKFGIPEKTSTPNFKSENLNGFTPPATLTRSQVGIDAKRSPIRVFSRRQEFPKLDSEFVYMAVLNEFLEDMLISGEERQQLGTLAAELGISPDREEQLRLAYIRGIEASCLRDGIVSEAEADLLNRFAVAMGIHITFSSKSESLELPKKGSTICVTGTATIRGVTWDKARWNTRLRELGYQFTDELRKSDEVALLLQESEGSQSSKVKKAISWGVPRMTFEHFLNQTEA